LANGQGVHGFNPALHGISSQPVVHGRIIVSWFLKKPFFCKTLYSNPQPVRSAGGWCWFVLREKYCWLIAGSWFVLREKYCWLVADKPSEFGASLCVFLFSPISIYPPRIWLLIIRRRRRMCTDSS
jgi:hypothetical protein